MAVLLLLATAVYGWVFWIGHFVARWWLHRTLRPGVELIAPERLRFLLEQALASDVISSVAPQGLLFVALVVALQVYRREHPLDGVALGVRGFGPAFTSGLSQGLTIHLLLLLMLAALSGGPPGPAGAVARQCAMLVMLGGQWASLGVLSLVAMPVTLVSYALARLLIPGGVVLVGARRQGWPVLAALWAALAFGAPYLLSPLATPLAVLNQVLFGLVLGQLQNRWRSLWAPVAALAGWVLIGEFSGLAHQGAVGRLPDLLPAAPPLLGGGAYGPEGGLLMSLTMLAWLTVLLAGPPSHHRPTPASATDHATD